jgi:hypothetical protein
MGTNGNLQDLSVSMQDVGRLMQINPLAAEQLKNIALTRTMEAQVKQLNDLQTIIDEKAKVVD